MAASERLNVTDRFDGAAVWATLNTEHKDAIGAALLEQIASEYMADRAFDDDRPEWDRIAGAAEQACRAVIKDVFVEAIPRELLETATEEPKIPSLLGMVCEACGCSENAACPQGCSWARDNLCTACVGPAGTRSSEGG